MKANVTDLNKYNTIEIKTFKNVKLAVNTTVRARLLRASISPILTEHKITYREIEILCAVECYEVIYYDQLARYLLLNPLNVSNICKKLEHKGLIYFYSHRLDHPGLEIKLTYLGKYIVKSLEISKCKNKINV